jgi:hypothetical protein
VRDRERELKEGIEREGEKSDMIAKERDRERH